MKKMLCLLLAAVLALSLMAGCDRTPGGEPLADPTGVTTDPTELTTEPTTEPATEPTTEPATEPTTEPSEVEDSQSATTPANRNWTMTIPEDFANLGDDETASMWMAQDLSQIYVMAMPRDETFLTITEEKFVTDLIPSADEGSVVIKSYTNGEIDGYPALCVDYTFSVSGMPVHGYYYLVVADQNYCFLLNDYTEDTWAEAFRQAVQSIDIMEADV